MSDQTTLEMLVHLLSQHAGETGQSEGAVETIEAEGGDVPDEEVVVEALRADCACERVLGATMEVR